MNTGQIIKSKVSNQYTKISNTLLQDPKLSARAKGLIGMMLSMPEDWVMYKKTLPDYFSDGYEALLKAWEELEGAGYIVSVQIIDPSGKFAGWNHVVYAEPVLPENAAIPTESGFAGIGSHRAGNSGHTKKQLTNKQKTNRYIVVPTTEEEIEFENFRKHYPGTKGGYINEFKNLKRFPDYKEIIPLLRPALEKWMRWRQVTTAAGQFVPPVANLSTWINQRRWENEYQSPSMTQPSIKRNQTLE